MIHGSHLVACILRLGQIGKRFPICLPLKMLETILLAFVKEDAIISLLPFSNLATERRWDLWNTSSVSLWRPQRM